MALMTKEQGFKDAGDRVVVINKNGFGEHGVVEENDGFGEVSVVLDSGSLFHGYELRDLIYEDEPLPSDPIDAGESSTPNDDLLQIPDRSLGFINNFKELFVAPDGSQGFLETLSRGKVFSQKKRRKS